MKVSFYNHYIKQPNGVICYNALTDAYLILKENVFHDFETNICNLQQFQDNYPKQYETLCKNGYIIEDDFNEKEHYMNLYYERKFVRSIYELIVNPTLNCNLGCWYCYESHKAKSELSDEIIDSILLHIENKHKLDKFSQFTLSFFGGEPMLKPKIVVELIKKINDLAIEKDFKFSVHFTTNGTILPIKILSLLKNYNVSFQITLDGIREVHNKTRFFKNKNNGGSYDLIMKNIRKIKEELMDYHITIRINYTGQTLYGINQIIDDFDFCDRKKTTFSLHKVWQENKIEINKSLLFDFINYAKTNNFVVYYMDICSQYSTCYADNYNEAIINYNGDVYKCTARDFAVVKPEGKLQKDGTILWDTEKLMTRTNLRLSKMCMDCTLLPVCGGICSQHRLEIGEKVTCRLEEEYTKEDYIIHNLNRQLITNKIFNI